MGRSRNTTFSSQNCTTAGATVRGGQHRWRSYNVHSSLTGPVVQPLCASGLPPWVMTGLSCSTSANPLTPCCVPTSILSGYAGVALTNVNVWFQLCATATAASISVANLCPGTSLKLQRCATGCEHCAAAQASHGKAMPWRQPGAASLFHRARATW